MKKLLRAGRADNFCRAASVVVGVLCAAAVPHVVSQTLEEIHAGVTLPLQGEVWTNPHADESYGGIERHLREAQVSDTLEAECVSNLEAADGVAALCTALGGWIPYTHAWVSGGRFVAAADHSTGFSGYYGVHTEEKENGALARHSGWLRDARVGGYPVGKGLTEAAFDEKQEDLAGFGERVNLVPDAGLIDQDIRVEVSITSEQSVGTSTPSAFRNERCLIPGGRGVAAFCPEGSIPQTLALRIFTTDGTPFSTTRDITFQVSISGTATPGLIVNGMPVASGTDYQTIDPFKITVPRGMSNASESFGVEIYDDNLAEDVETIVFASTPEGTTTSNPNAATLYILDNDNLPYLIISDFIHAVDECDARVSVPIDLIGSSTQDVTVLVHTAPVGITTPRQDTGSATADVDYTSVVNQPFTFTPNGQKQQNVDISIVADGIPAGEPGEHAREYFAVQMTSETNARFLPDPNDPGRTLDHALVQINDESCPENIPMISIGGGPDVTEGEEATFTITANPVPTTTLMVTLDVAQSGDYVADDDLGTKMVQVPSGTKTYTVGTISDNVDEPPGSVTITLKDGTGYTVAPSPDHEASVAIRDDDIPHRIGLASSSVLVSEGAGPAKFRVRLNRQSDTAITVRYRTQDGAATMGADYEQTSGVLTFAAGELEKPVLVQIIDDALHEEDETFTLELADAQGAELGAAIGRATITDNDAAPTISIAPAAYVREGGTANVYLSLSNASSRSVMVPYSTDDVTATAGKDYVKVSVGLMTIEPGDTGTVIQVQTQDDAVHEGREAFLVQFAGGGQTTVTILDNDRLPQLSIGDATVSEDGERAELTVSLSGTSAARVGVAYATHDGTAEAGVDYTRTLGTLVFAPGETVRYVWVPVARDDVVEEDEGLVVRLSAPEHAALLDAEGGVTIKDDPIEVSIFDGSEMENSEELVMPVRLNFGSTKVVSVQFEVTGGTATLDVDYDATEGLIVFEPGSTDAQVRIPLIDDDLQEGNEMFNVTLLSPTNAQIGQAMATGTIVDDETAPGVQVRAIAVSQSEVVFAVGLLAPVAERMTGRYRTVDGTAWAGEDYERMEGVLEFGPGEIRKEVRVPLLRAQGSGEAFALMVELGDATVREEVVLGSEDTGTRARLGRSVAVHIVEAVSERMEGSLVGCMPRPFPGQRVRVSHLLSGCGMQASGERLSVWGRGAYSRLQSGGISGADVVTASLGADYRAGGRWLMGMVISRSEALEQEGTLLQMTGWYPYVRYGGMRHSVWGLAGAGQGVVAEAADTGMRLVAAGVGGTLVRRAGARLGYEADGFWLGIDSGIGVSRVRAGLEGSVTLQDILEPYVEAAVLHSGGDAERGMGMEAGGGLRVRMGMLHAEVMSRRLVLHQEDGYGEWGYSGMIRYGGMEGLGAQVRPTWGRTHVGTLWQSERPWEVYPSDRRMELEVGYGSSVRRRSVLRPHVGMGLRDRGRDYRIGAGVQGRTGLGFSVSGLAMEHMAPYRPVSYGVTASGYVRW